MGIFRQILQGKLDFESEPWPAISQSAKDLIRKMLDRNPKKRLTAHQVLCLFSFFPLWTLDGGKNYILASKKFPVLIELCFVSGHPWIVDDRIAPDKPLDSAVLSRLKQFSAMNKLKKMALRVRILFSSCIFTCSVSTLGLSLLPRFQLSYHFY